MGEHVLLSHTRVSQSFEEKFQARKSLVASGEKRRKNRRVQFLEENEGAPYLDQHLTKAKTIHML